MTSNLKTPHTLPEGVWQGLLQHAYSLIDEIAAHGIQNPFWTFGGGTVLMLRHLGFVSPRLSDVAEAVADQYVEGPGYIKLLRAEGEIDFVASPNLTSAPFEVWELLGRQVKVETSAEIVAKKLWHRGDRATARDLFDLALVIDREPVALATATPFLTRHRDAFLKQVHERKVVLKAQFEAIDTLDYQPTYEQAVESVAAFLLQKQ